VLAPALGQGVANKHPAQGPSVNSGAIGPGFLKCQGCVKSGGGLGKRLMVVGDSGGW
jgi:hypothetical protein